MYRIMLVDDEPLILAGIKTLLNWPEEDCELVGNARNGRQALEFIGNLWPDIIIADINMPVMDGIELLKQTGEKYPEIVFIMLTNLQEFELARDALRYHAVDYLVKTQLEPDILRESLHKAKEEADRRSSTGRSLIEKDYRQVSEARFLADSVKLLLASRNIAPETEHLFLKAGVLNGYLLLSVQFIYPEYLAGRDMDIQNPGGLLHWEQEVIRELAGNCFPCVSAGDPDDQNHQMLILVWGNEAGSYEEQLRDFYKKLTAASSDITGIMPCLLATDTLAGKDSLSVCRGQLLSLRDYFYLTGVSFLRYRDMEEIHPVPLGLSGIAGSLQKELNGKNAIGCAALFERAINRIEQEPHEKAQALWLCTELYFTVCEALQNRTGGEQGDIFSDSAEGYAQIRLLSTRRDVVRFLYAINNELQNILQPGISRRGELIESVKHYICENIDKRIILQEAAGKVYLSPGYLSSVFKKHCGESFVDFVNRCKVEKACELLKREELLIGQVGDLLSFENAYYFAKIFKKYMAMTPSEYREGMKKGRS